MKKRERQQGSITVEATLVLTVFIMGYMCMMSLVQIVRTQTIMQYVVDQAAMDISRNTYLLTKSGITAQLYGTAKKGKKFEGDTAKVIGKVDKFYKSLGAVTSSNGQNIVSNTENAVNSFNNMTDGVDDYVKTYFSNSDELWSTLTTWGKMKGAQFVENGIVSAMVESRVKKQLEGLGSGSAEECLQKLGVKNGMSGLTFKGTEWIQPNSEGRPGIRIEMTYEMEYNWYYFLIKDLKYKVTAYTAVW